MLLTLALLRSLARQNPADPGGPAGYVSLGDDTTSTLAAEDAAYTNGGEVDDDHAVCPAHVVEPHRRGPTTLCPCTLHPARTSNLRTFSQYLAGAQVEVPQQ